MTTPDQFFPAQVKEGKKITGPEQLKDAAFGCARIRGDTLGIVGLGEFHWSPVSGWFLRLYVSNENFCY